MKIFVFNQTQISVELTSVCFWIWIADKHLQFLQTKHLQCIDYGKILEGVNTLLELKRMPNLKYLNCQHLSSEIEQQNLRSQLPNIIINENCGDLNIAIPTESIQAKDGFWDIQSEQISMFPERGRDDRLARLMNPN